MRHKNEQFKALCIDYTHDGLGICKDDGFPFFVKGMMKGETAILKVLKVLKNYGVAKIETMIETSPDRVEPPCRVYKRCGGCHLQHLSPQAQQAFKTQVVVQSFKKIAHMDDVVIEPCAMSPEPYNYRNKVQLPCGMVDGHLVCGFYKQHSNEIVANDYCHIQNHQANVLIAEVKKLLEELKVTVYNKETHRGLLRHIMVKASHSRDELMLVLITNGKSMKHKMDFVDTVVQKFPNVCTIIQNINERHDNVILGDKSIVLYGPGYIEDHIKDLIFQISCHSFFQVNPIQTEVLYDYALQFAQLTGKETVIDAYCGIGTISLFLARHAKKVYGVEIVPQAIDNARENALKNGIDNCEFILNDAKVYMQEMVEQHQTIDVVVCDPPRKGCSLEFLDAVDKLHPKRLVYVSCNVATLARDAVILKGMGYTLKKVQPVDMFPQTYGVEAVSLFELEGTTYD